MFQFGFASSIEPPVLPAGLTMRLSISSFCAPSGNAASSMRIVSKVAPELKVSVPVGNESPGVVAPCASAVPTTTGAPAAGVGRGERDVRADGDVRVFDGGEIERHARDRPGRSGSRSPCPPRRTARGSGPRISTAHSPVLASVSMVGGAASGELNDAVRPRDGLRERRRRVQRQQRSAAVEVEVDARKAAGEIRGVVAAGRRA